MLYYILYYIIIFIFYIYCIIFNIFRKKIVYVPQSIRKETCEYRCLRKTNFSENFDFQRIFSTKSKCRLPLKFFQTFIMIRDGMTLCQCFSWSKSNTSKFFMAFYHDAPNSYVPGFLGFLVNALLAASHNESARHACS